MNDEIKFWCNNEACAAGGCYCTVKADELVDAEGVINCDECGARMTVEPLPMTTYKVIRHFMNSNRKLLIKSGLTLAQAQAHCRNPETSSSTCTKSENRARTRKSGPWFDGYVVQK